MLYKLFSSNNKTNQIIIFQIKRDNSSNLAWAIVLLIKINTFEDF